MVGVYTTSSWRRQQHGTMIMMISKWGKKKTFIRVHKLNIITNAIVKQCNQVYIRLVTLCGHRENVISNQH